MKTTNLLTKFTRLVNDLKQERGKLADRMAEIDAVLASTSSQNGHVRSSDRVARPRTKNKLTLRDAVTQAVKTRSLDKKEIVAAVERLGYRFATKDPIGSISALVYSVAGKKQFRNEAGKFSAR